MTLLAYSLTMECLIRYAPTTAITFYLTVWTLCFMPFIYEVRGGGASYSIFGRYEANVVRIVIVLLSFPTSLYPALHPVLRRHAGFPTAYGTVVVI